MKDEHDPLLDACLEELLGGQTPPDLSERILRAGAALPPRIHDSTSTRQSKETAPLHETPGGQHRLEFTDERASPHQQTNRHSSSVGATPNSSTLPASSPTAPTTKRRTAAPDAGPLRMVERPVLYSPTADTAVGPGSPAGSLSPPRVPNGKPASHSVPSAAWQTPAAVKPKPVLASAVTRVGSKPGLGSSFWVTTLAVVLVVFGIPLGWRGFSLWEASKAQQSRLARSTSARNDDRTSGERPLETRNRRRVAADRGPEPTSPATLQSDLVGQDGASTKPLTTAEPPSVRGPQMAKVLSEDERPRVSASTTATVKSASLPEILLPETSPVSDAEVVRLIDESLRRSWEQAELEPAPNASDQEVVERLFERVLGRAPTPDELRRYLQDGPRDKRARWAKQLVEGETYVEEFARHWSRFWTESLVGSRPGPLPNGANRDGLEQFLRRAILRKQPFHEVAYELLTATGSGVPGTPGYNGAANFLIAHWDRHARQATEQTARLFLGQDRACTACHDHPTRQRLAQSQFWELNAFLRQVALERGAAGQPVLANCDFAGDGGNDRAAAEVFFETPAGELKVAYPALLGYSELPRSGVVAEFDRRAFLATFLTRSESFRQSTVNRVWSALFGFGLQSPELTRVDAQPVAYEALLAALADSFARSNHDFAALVRQLVCSEPFGLSVVGPKGPQGDLPEWGDVPRFSRFYIAPEDKATTLERLRQIAAGSTQARPGEFPAGPTAAKLDPLGAKPRIPTLLPSSALSTLSGLPNFRFQQHLSGTPIEAILGSERLSRQQKLEHLFMATVRRLPSRLEVEEVESLFTDAAQERVALAHLWWALAFSPEATSLR
jgi:hypothetical protein